MAETEAENRSGHYQNNIQQNFGEPAKTPEKQQLLNGDERYTPTAKARPVVVVADEQGKTQNELGSPPEKQNLLEPAFEPNSEPEVEFKKGAEEKVEEEKAPIDKWNIVYFILILHGVGTLMPWNMFITADAYFTDYKLAGPGPGNMTGNMTGNSTTDASAYRNYFLSFLGFTAQIPNLILNFLNLFCQCGGGGNIMKRIVWSIIIVVLMFIITVILAMVDSSEWPGTFFWITMVTVVIINMANGVYQNSVYGTAAYLPMKYTNAVVLGSNVSGTLASLLMIISIASTPNPRTSAVYYFLAAIFILLVAFDTFFALPMIPFYKYYHKKAQVVKSDNAAISDRPPFLHIFKKCWKQDLGVFFVFFVTLSCFPAIQAGVERSSSSFFISDKFFAPITCFLFFNTFATLGNLFSEFVRKPGPRWVWIPILFRVLFIPFFMFCNYQPKLPAVRALPVLISNDYVYCLGGILLAFTSGYFSSLTMMYAPREVEPQHQGTAGMMAAFFLILGIVSGVIFSLPVTIFIEKVG